MSLDVYRTRSTTVEAIQYDGSNLEEINNLLAATGRPGSGTPSLGYVLDPGCWVVFTGRTFQVLPNSVFHRVYELDQPALILDPTPLVKVLHRSCFLCVHYAMSNASVSRCTLFNEPIDHEVQAAADCSAYEQAI